MSLRYLAKYLASFCLVVASGPFFCAVLYIIQNLKIRPNEHFSGPGRAVGVCVCACVCVSVVCLRVDLGRIRFTESGFRFIVNPDSDSLANRFVGVVGSDVIAIRLRL